MVKKMGHPDALVIDTFQKKFSLDQKEVTLMHSLNIFILALILTSQSFADSSCWPEEQLVGKTARGFVEGAHFKLQKVKSPIQKAMDDCNVELFTKPEEKIGTIQPCKQIQCIKGECGDGGDYTSIPIESPLK